MVIVKVYKGGSCHEVHPSTVELYLAKGFTRSPDEGAPLEIDLSPFDNSQLLHIASIANVIVPPDAERDAVEALLQSTWDGLGHPAGWLEACLAAPAPVAPEEVEVPPVHVDEEPVAVEDFDASITEPPADPPVSPQDDDASGE